MDRREIAEKQYLAKLALLDNVLEQFPRLKYAMVNHRNIRGEEMRFDDKPYLMEIYRDDAPQIVLKSSVQTGKSEFLIVSAHSWAERGLQVLYVLPTIDIRNLFVANRVDKLYEIAPHYRKQIAAASGSSDSRGLKHFGNKHGAIFFAGSNSKTTFIEKPIDLVVGDEIDQFDQANYEKADDRMTASPWKLKYEAANPTVDKYGVDYRWRKSDQRSWFVKCGSCNYWQAIDWFKNVVRQTDDDRYLLLDDEWEYGMDRDIHLHCVRCGNKLDRYDIKGQWVAKYPKIKNLHGYHIHQLLSSFVKVDLMWDKFQEALNDDTKMQVFYNSMLGLTFAGKGAKLTDELLNRCKRDYLMPAHVKESCFMGVDVGKVLHVTINKLLEGGRLQLVYAGTVREFEELDLLFQRFNIVSYAIDSMPETRKATEYAKKHTGRGWIVRYHQGLMEVQDNSDTRVISADRTMIMDRAMKYFTEQRFLLPKNAQTLDRGDLYELLKNPTRIFDEEKNRYDWLGNQDHYYHSYVYSLLAYMVRGDISVSSVALGSEVQQVKELPKTFESAVPFPPGTPEHIRKHYEHIYAQAQAQSKINKDSE